MGRESRKKHKRRHRDSYDSRSDSYERRRRRRSSPPRNPGYFRPRRRDFRRDRSPEDRPFRFDSPPKDQDNVMGAMAAAKVIGGGLASARDVMQSIQTMTMTQASKVDRKLYVGNLPPDITPKQLVDLLNHALIKVKGNINPGDPVISAWIASDGHYAFVEFRSPEEANNGFALNNISIHGNTLKVGRPNTYNGAYSSLKLMSGSALMMGESMTNPEKHAVNVLDADESMFDPLGEKKMITQTGEKQPEPAPKPEDNNADGPLVTKMGVFNAITGGSMSTMMGGTVSGEVYRIELPSRVIVLKDIVKYEYVAYEDDYEDLIDDLKKELNRHGMIVNIKIPHYQFLERKEQEQEEEKKDGEKPKEESKILSSDEIDLSTIKAALPKKQGFGNVYVEYVSEEDAKKARKELNGRRYGKSFVEVSYHSLEKFENDDFSEPEIITTGKENMQGFEGMEHMAIEFKDGVQSSVQDEIRNFRKTLREGQQNQLAIKGDQEAKKGIQQAQVYRKEEAAKAIDPVINYKIL